jgi:P27 family predicted phage terminase small subunit
MGRKSKPTKLKLLDGNPGKKKIPKNEIQPISNLPSPPSHLDDYAKQEWERLANGLHTLGLLYQVDRAVFAAYCQAYSRWRIAEETLQMLAEKDDLLHGILMKTKQGNWIQQPIVGIANKAMADMARYASEFGLTPVARAGLSVEMGGGSSKFTGLIGLVK